LAKHQYFVVVIFVLACAALLFTSPIDGRFWWSDAPRHALNGAFVKDFFIALPLRHPVTWAYNYYLQYPSLSILFYPPLFYGVEALMYAIFGVSDLVAQATVTLFIFFLAMTSYGIARRIFPFWSALAVALIVIGTPETAFWARQVMLDVPAYAILVGGVFFFIRYIENSKPRDIYFSALAILASIYIKLNAGFIIPVLFVAFLVARGRAALRDRHALTAAIFGAVCVIPAVLLTLRFGMVNVQSINGRPGDLPRTGLAAWLFYADQLPHQASIAIIVLAFIGIFPLITRRIVVPGHWFSVLLIGWFVIGYLAFSAISVREPRHSLMILFPLAIVSVMALHWLLPQRFATTAALILGSVVFLHSLIFGVPPEIRGYGKVVNYVVAHAPPHAIILFSGYRDGNFVFDMRTHEERRDIITLRADKLLLKVAVERLRGVQQTNYDQHEIAKMLRELGVDMVVYQPGFWEDLRQMARLAEVLHTNDFEKIAMFPISGTVNHTDQELEIFRPTYPVDRTRRDLQLDLPIIGRQISGDLAPSR